MTKPVDKQLDDALATWHQQQPGMPTTLRQQIHRKLERPSSTWQRRWREGIALVSCSVVAAIWWQLAQTSELMYQVVRTEQAGRVIEIHQLTDRAFSETQLASQSTDAQVPDTNSRQLAFQQQYQGYLQQQQATASQHRLMRASMQGEDLLLTDCQEQQILVSKQLWQAWAKEQDLTPAQFEYLDVAQGAQGQIIALKFAPQGRNCTAP